MEREKKPSWLGRLFNQWFPAPPSSPGQLLVSARQLYESGDYTGCIDLLTRALAAPPDREFVPALAYKWRGLAHQALGAGALALADLEEVVRLKSRSRGGYIDLARFQQAQGAARPAIATLSQGIERVPSRQSPLLYLERGKVSYAVRDYLAAIDDFNVAAYHLPRLAEARLWRGLSRAWLSEYQLAIRDCKKAVELAPGDHHAHYALGRVLFRAGRYAAAAGALLRTVELAAEQPATLSLLGRSLLQTGAFDQALPYLESAVALGAEDDATVDALRLAAMGMPPVTGVSADGDEAPPCMEVLEKVEEAPLFPDFNRDISGYYEKQRIANEALQEFLRDHLRYPLLASRMGREGVVWIAFTVERNGRLSKSRVHQGVSYELDREALRLVQRMIDLGIHWEPAKRHGVAVPVTCRLPVVFQLPD